MDGSRDARRRFTTGESLMSNEVKIGLLPLYLELYDRALPAHRKRMEEFYGLIADEFRKRGFGVETAPLCRLKPEFIRAVSRFERAGVSAMVTLHLAYSPSLESADALAGSSLPLIALDTTQAYDFGPGQNPDEIMFNHGIHGVQDMCNVLMRRGKKIVIEAGHWRRSDVIDRVCAHAMAAAVACALRDMRTGIVGKPFHGMGDFSIPAAALKRLTGHAPDVLGPAQAKNLVASATAGEIMREIESECARFSVSGISGEKHRLSVRAGLALRKWLEHEQIGAFSINFLAVTKASGLPLMPFPEIGKAMARGIGYAGEGDLLTAALVGALMRVYPQTTFTEMFCPDWKGNRVFLSHMGEVNLDLIAGRPKLVEKPWKFTDTPDPLVAVGRLKPGRAVFVNLAPMPGGRFRLIVAPGAMQDAKHDKFSGSVRGWFAPRSSLAEFLAAYSAAGGTHHAALVYGKAEATLRSFGAFMDWETLEL